MFKEKGLFDPESRGESNELLKCQNKSLSKDL